MRKTGSRPQFLAATVANGKDLPAIPADTPVTIDVLGVGSTFPGRRLVVRVQFQKQGGTTWGVGGTLW